MRFYVQMRWQILLLSTCVLAEVNVQELVRRSVAASQKNWQEAPNYVWHERHIEEKLDSRGRPKSQSTKTVEVMILEGSEYRRLLKTDGHPLSAEEAAAEKKKLEAERLRRQHESPAERARRVNKYQKEREQDRAMIREMAEAFDFRLEGEETINGHSCYVLDATPKAGYVAKTRDTKVLHGMRGRMWVDKESAQWVKVIAEVIKPVSLYAVATVGPGTKFILEQEPVGGGVWLPKHFAVRVNASVLMFSRKTSEDDTFSNYRRMPAQVAKY